MCIAITLQSSAITDGILPVIGMFTFLDFNINARAEKLTNGKLYKSVFDWCETRQDVVQHGARFRTFCQQLPALRQGF